VDIPDLHPLSLGELLDRTFTYYRRHFWTLVGIMAIPQVLIVAVNVLLQSFQPCTWRARAIHRRTWISGKGSPYSRSLQARSYR
jgi:hypothetical protein